MARFDQVHISARARLQANWLDADVGKILAVSLNANGRVVKGNPVGSTGVRGLVALGLARKAGHPIDMMRQGEILDVATTDIAGTLVAGAPVYLTSKTTAAGTLTMANTSGFVVGFLVEIDRLIVDMRPDTTAGAAT